MKVGSKIIVEIGEDGSIKTNGVDLIGEDAELLKDLESLAEEVGGKLTVEKHVHSHSHSHSHSQGHSHSHTLKHKHK